MNSVRLSNLWPVGLVAGLALALLVLSWLLSINGWLMTLLGLVAIAAFVQLVEQDRTTKTSHLRNLEGQHRELQGSLREAEQRCATLTGRCEDAESLHAGARQALIALGADGRIKSWNAEAGRTFEFADGIQGYALAETLHDLAPALEAWLAERPSENRQQDVTIAGREYSVGLSPMASGGYVVALAEIRGSDKVIQRLEAETRQLRDQLTQAQTRIQELEQSVRQHQVRVAEREQTIQERDRTTQERDAEIEQWKGYADGLEQEISGLKGDLRQAQADLGQRLDLKRKVLASLEGIAAGAVIVRGDRVCWMNQHARDLFGYPLDGDTPFPPIASLLPDLTAEVRGDLTSPGDEERLAPEPRPLQARRREGFRLRVLVEAMPTELLDAVPEELLVAVPTEVMTAEDTQPEEPDLLLILRDGTPQKVRDQLREYVCLPWWKETPADPVRPTESEAVQRTPSVSVREPIVVETLEEQFVSEVPAPATESYHFDDSLPVPPPFRDEE